MSRRKRSRGKAWRVLAFKQTETRSKRTTRFGSHCNMTSLVLLVKGKLKIGKKVIAMVQVRADGGLDQEGMGRSSHSLDLFQ